jgi:hypothetical protein
MTASSCEKIKKPPGPGGQTSIWLYGYAAVMPVSTREAGRAKRRQECFDLAGKPDCQTYSEHIAVCVLTATRSWQWSESEQSKSCRMVTG